MLTALHRTSSLGANQLSTPTLTSSGSPLQISRRVLRLGGMLMRRLSPLVPYGISTVSRALVGVEAPDPVVVYSETQETVCLLG